MVLKDCDNCLVYGTDNHPLAKARVEVTKTGKSELYFRSTKLRSVRFKTYVDFYDGQQGVVRCQCELVIKKNSGPSRLNEPWMADCSILQVKDIFQRQKDLRIDVQIASGFRADNGWYFTGTIKNISAGGVFVSTSYSMKKNDRFSFSCNFDDVFCKMYAKVLRVGTLSDGSFGYGCQFVALPVDMEAAIRKFVYSRQKEKIAEKQRKN